MQILALILSIDNKSHPSCNIDNFIRIYINSMEDLFLHGKDIKMTKGLEMPSIVSRCVWKLRVDGDQ